MASRARTVDVVPRDPRGPRYDRARPRRRVGLDVGSGRLRGVVDTLRRRGRPALARHHPRGVAGGPQSRAARGSATARPAESGLHIRRARGCPPLDSARATTRTMPDDRGCSSIGHTGCTPTCVAFSSRCSMTTGFLAYPVSTVRWSHGRSDSVPTEAGLHGLVEIWHGGKYQCITGGGERCGSPCPGISAPVLVD